MSALKVYDAASGTWRYVSGVSWVGMTQLVYKYTVTGSVKSSIDTGVDAPQAGNNDWTNMDLLEIHAYSRTDASGVNISCIMQLNNDSGSNYDYQWQRIFDTGAANAISQASTSFGFQAPGTTVANTTTFAPAQWQFVNPMGSVGYKPFTGLWGYSDPGDVNQPAQVAMQGQWKSTSAINRVAISPSPGGSHWSIGTQLLVYKRIAS